MTFDLDILIEATPENTRQLLEALLDAGLGTASLTDVEEILSKSRGKLIIKIYIFILGSGES